MQENRSFDHYFGTLRGVRGYGDPRPVMLPSGRSVFHQPSAGRQRRDPALPPGQRHHQRPADQEPRSQLEGRCRRMGALRRLGQAQDAADDGPFPPRGHPLLPRARRRLHDLRRLSRLDPRPDQPQPHVPVHRHQRACRWATPGRRRSPTPTTPTGPPTPPRTSPTFKGAGWTTYAERLQASGVSWKLYQEYDNFGDNSLAFFKRFRGLAPERRPLPARPRDRARLDRRPTPTHERRRPSRRRLRQGRRRRHAAAGLVDRRADQIFRASRGAARARRVADRAADRRRSPPIPAVWAKTVFILNYDENDGFFDHCPPPVPALAPGAGQSTVDAARRGLSGPGGRPRPARAADRGLALVARRLGQFAGLRPHLGDPLPGARASA